MPKSAKSQKAPAAVAKPATPQDKSKAKAPLTKPTVIDNSLLKKKGADQVKPAEAQKRAVDGADKSGNDPSIIHIFRKTCRF